MLGDYFKRVAEKANSTANGETAKKIRRNFITGGVIGCVISGVLVLVGVGISIWGAMSAVSGMSGAVNDLANSANAAMNSMMSMITRCILGVILAGIGGIGLAISVTALKVGFGIVIAGVTTNVLDANKRCPKCHEVIDDNTNFCTKCGYKAAIECPNCHAKSDHDDVYCSNCGTKIR